MEFQILLALEDVTFYRRGVATVGTVSFTQHHFFFRGAPSAAKDTGGMPNGVAKAPIARPPEVWMCYPLIDRVDFHRGGVSAIEDPTESQSERLGAMLSSTLGFGSSDERAIDLDEPAMRKERGANIRIQFRDFACVAMEFKNILRAQEAFDIMLRLTCIDSVKDVYAFSYKQVRLEQGFNGWELYNVARELAREGVDMTKWRLTDLNKDYHLCETYPRKLVVAAGVSDALVRHAVKFRSKNRFPVLSYYYAPNGCTISRCAQPLVGIKQSRSLQDEQLVLAMFHTNAHEDARNLIVDARPVTNATAQMALGAGSEKVEYYGSQCRKIYLSIDNIHVMRDCLGRVKDLLKNSDIDGGVLATFNREAVDRTGWLDHIRGILKGVDSLTKWLTLEGVHVMIHCSDGWDRTAQVSSLVQVCVDPYFRTLEGICVLVEKEWCSFGHRFNDRCGHVQSEVKFYNHTETGGFQKIRTLNQRFQHHQGVKLESPVFHQFLDCLYQLLEQHGDAFEYNERFLRRLLYHLYSCQYGTFLGDCERERAELGVYDRTRSVWDYFLCRRAQFVNQNYRQRDDILDVGYGPGNVSFWGELYGVGKL